MHIRHFAKKVKITKTEGPISKAKRMDPPPQSSVMNTQVTYETSETSIYFLNCYCRHDTAITDRAPIIIINMRPLASLNIVGVSP